MNSYFLCKQSANIEFLRFPVFTKNQMEAVLSLLTNYFLNSLIQKDILRSDKNGSSFSWCKNNYCLCNGMIRIGTPLNDEISTLELSSAEASFNPLINLLSLCLFLLLRLQMPHLIQRCYNCAPSIVNLLLRDWEKCTWWQIFYLFIFSRERRIPFMSISFNPVITLMLR